MTIEQMLIPACLMMLIIGIVIGQRRRDPDPEVMEAWDWQCHCVQALYVARPSPEDYRRG